MRVIDLSDTPYEGTLPSYGHTGAKSARERRGKCKGNKRRLPSWRHDETLDVLMMTRTPSARRAQSERARTPEPTAPQVETYSDRMARFGSVGKDYNED